MVTALITGSNRGIGLELAKKLKERGYTVLAACRKTSPALTALGVEVLEGADVADEASVRALKDRVGARSLDLVIANSGILESNSLGALDLASIRRQFEVNALGSLNVVASLRAQIPKGGKVALVTSRMGSLADNTSGGHYGYRMSKAALNMAGVSLAHDLAPAGIAVALLHPGYVKTDMTGGGGQISADASAAQLVDRIEALTLETSGTFWHANGEVLPW